MAHTQSSRGKILALCLIFAALLSLCPAYSSLYESSPATGGGGGAPTTATYITESDESASLPDSYQLLAGSGITLTPGTNSLTLSSSASGGFTYTSESSSFAAAAQGMYGVTATTGTVTATLPTAVGIAGQEIVISLRATGATLTIATTSSQTIDQYSSGALSTTTQYNTFRLASDGSNWILE